MKDIGKTLIIRKSVFINDLMCQIYGIKNYIEFISNLWLERGLLSFKIHH